MTAYRGSTGARSCCATRDARPPEPRFREPIDLLS